MKYRKRGYWYFDEISECKDDHTTEDYSLNHIMTKGAAITSEPLMDILPVLSSYIS